VVAAAPGSPLVRVEPAWHDDNHLDQLRRALEGKA